MRELIRRAVGWLRGKWEEVVVQAVVIPFVGWLMNVIIAQYFESEVVRAVLFGVVFLALIAGGCWLLYLNDKRRTAALRTAAAPPAPVAPPLPVAPPVQSPALQNERLRLMRLIQEGEAALAGYQTIADGDARGALDATANLSQWYRETLEWVGAQHPAQAEHFGDLKHFGALGYDECEGQVRTLLRRLADLERSLKPNQ